MTLTEEVAEKLLELPHRGAGTVFEKRAADFLTLVYKNLGMDPKESAFRIGISSLNWHLIISYSLFILAILVNFLGFFLLTAVVFLIATAFYFQIPLKSVNLLKKYFAGGSQNVHVEIPAESPSGYTLVVSGHYDTGNDYSEFIRILGPLFKLMAGPALSDPNSTSLTLPTFFDNPFFIGNLAILGVLLSIFVPDNGVKLFFSIISGIPLIFTIFVLYKNRIHFVPGAFDNTVGTAMVVELAAYYNKTRPLNLNLIFANTGAEEGLTRGMLHLAKSLNLDKTKTFFLNLDCIGEEVLMISNSEPIYPVGTLRQYDVSSIILYEFITQVYTDEHKFTQSPSFTENADLLMNGYRVMGTLWTLPRGNYPTQYHSKTDTKEKIKWDKVDELTDLLKDYIDYLDSVIVELKP